LNDRTKIVAVTQVSNALGTVVPVKEIVELAHRAGAKALVDGAQSVSHMRVDVQDLGADFFVFSGHKVFGPTGIGVVWGKREVLEDMPPWQGGGNMIADVTFEKTVFQPIPNKFEAGTGNIADAVGLGAAIDYVNKVGIENIARYEHDLLVYGMQQLGAIPGVRLIGTAADKASVMSFVLDGYTTEEVGHALNDEGIAVRTGHHCAQPILRRFGVETTVRPSLAFYNTFDEVDRLVTVVRRLAGHRRGATPLRAATRRLSEARSPDTAAFRAAVFFHPLQRCQRCVSSGKSQAHLHGACARAEGVMLLSLVKRVVSPECLRLKSPPPARIRTNPAT
jgi:cysteine desulfurase/selenocysteine lyase